MQADLQWLTNPAVFQVNRLDAHSDHMCCASAQEAARGETSLRQSLDGVWRFAWSRAPAARPAAFWREDFDDSAFGTILVPGHMELQGYGQIQYINSLYPWDGHAQLLPPQIDWEDNPVGSYVRTFDLDPGLRGKRVCVSFQGVEQALFLWLNGHFVGYAEDSFTPSDFDLTPYIRPTGNRLCAEVFKRSSAAWIEDQDFFRFSGIFRSVFLYAKPAVHLEDLWLQAGLEGSDGVLSLRLLLSGETEGASVSCRVAHPDQGVLFDGALVLKPEGRYLRSQRLRFENVLPWSHQTPALYQVTLTLRSRGRVMEVTPCETGFRRLEIRDGIDPAWNVPGSLPEWRECVVDRARSMFERDKNHVSILFWSCGNESYAGEDILAMADFFRASDPSRIVHYEGVYNCRAYDRISDVESRMYAPP